MLSALKEIDDRLNNELAIIKLRQDSLDSDYADCLSGKISSTQFRTLWESRNGLY